MKVDRAWGRGKLKKRQEDSDRNDISEKGLTSTEFEEREESLGETY